MGLLALLLTSFMFTSCKHEEIVLFQQQEEKRTVAGFIGNNFDFSLLHAALKYTGLSDTLNNHLNEYTLLAPRNVAFNQLGIYKESDVLQLNKDSLYQALAHHILPRKLMEKDILPTIGIRYPTLAGQEVETARETPNLTFVDKKTYIWFSGSLVSRFDIETTNGVIHALDRIIKYSPNTVADYLESQPDYSIFVTGLKHFGLWEKLKEEDKTYTIFAPRNLHYGPWKIDADSIKRMDVNKVNGGLLFGSHIMVGRELYISDLAYAFMKGQLFLTVPVADAAGYNQNITAGRLHNFMPYNSLNAEYSVVVAKHKYPFGFREDNVSGSPYPYSPESMLGSRSIVNDDGTLCGGCTGQNGSLYPRADYKTKNGIIHDFRALLVLPNEAKK